MSYNTHHARGKTAKGEDVSEMVVVAVKASKEISKIALVWALTHVARPGDCIILLVVIPSESSGRRSWLFPRLSRGCAGGLRESQFGTLLEQKSDIADSCSQMMLKLKDVYDIDKINIKIKVVSGSKYGAVAAESKRVQANWVVLDKHLKHEEKSCINDLQCNIVVMKNSQPKVLRLNLVGSHELEPPIRCDSVKSTSDTKDPQNSTKGLDETPTSSPEVDALFTEAGNSSVSSSDPGTSPCFAMETIAAIKRQEHKSATEIGNLDVPLFDTGIEGLSPAKVQLQPRMLDIVGPDQPSSKDIQDVPQEFHTSAQVSTAEALMDKFSKLDKEAEICSMRYKSDLHFSVNVREAISLSKSAPPGPPPLCSVCQHKAPVFGKPPRWFSYSELEVATSGFSQANFLAEGGFGSVHRGVLPDGQAIAVKQHKLASSQGDQEFCSEVEVLSCAQHRNVVMLIGFCVEDRRRLLVYEYICNGSLDTHLYGCNREPLEWAARQKIAVGAARGLRYLHEECRVGCIVHRDMRPNNILLTHDFEPLVGDFGLARWQPDGDLGVLTRVIGTFGYLAPEYALSGQITEKADVYSFGVVLLELVTGRKAVDINRPKGQHCLTEWARPLLEEAATGKLIDPRLGKLFSDQEIRCMMHAASLCIRRDTHIRPRMSQVLRILEGDMVIDSSCCSMPVCTIGNMSRRMWLEQQQQQQLDNPIEKQDSESVSIGMSSPGQQQQQLDCPIEKQDSEALPVGTSPLEQQQQQLDSPIEKQDAEALPVGTSSLEQQQQQLDSSIEKQDSEALLVETSSLEQQQQQLDRPIEKHSEALLVETSSLEQQQQQLDRPIEKHSEALLVETSSLEQQQLQQLDSPIEKQDSEALLVETSSLEQQQLQQLNSPIEKSDLEALSVGTSFPEQQQLVSSIGKQDSEVSSVTSYEAFVC